MTTILKRGVSVAAAAICATIAVAGAAKAEDKKFTVAVIMPSLDISYWQWVAYGAKTKAQELGMNSIELDSHDSPTEQMSNIRTAITKGANAIVMGPVSSTSTPPVLQVSSRSRTFPWRLPASARSPARRTIRRR